MYGVGAFSEVDCLLKAYREMKSIMVRLVWMSYYAASSERLQYFQCIVAPSYAQQRSNKV